MVKQQVSESQRGGQCKRIVRLIVRLSGRGMTIREIASSAGVSTKTVRRDMRILEEISIPVFQDRNEDSMGERIVWRVDPHWMRRFS